MTLNERAGLIIEDMVELQADGSFKRAIMPINSSNPGKSLQSPLYSCDIEALQRKFELEKMKAMEETGSHQSRNSSARNSNISKLDPMFE